jgi:hypothetical protein
MIVLSAQEKTPSLSADWAGKPLAPAFMIEQPPSGAYLDVEIDVLPGKRNYPFCNSRLISRDGRYLGSVYRDPNGPYAVTDIRENHQQQLLDLENYLNSSRPVAAYTAVMHPVSEPDKLIPVYFYITRSSAFPAVPIPADLIHLIRDSCFETPEEFSARRAAVANAKQVATLNERQERLAAGARARQENFAGVSIGQSASTAISLLKAKGYRESDGGVALHLRTLGQANYTALYDEQEYEIDEKKGSNLRNCLVRYVSETPVGMISFSLNDPASKKDYRVNLCVSSLPGEVKDLQAYLKRAIVVEIHAYVSDGYLHSGEEFAKQAHDRYPASVDGTKVAAIREGVTVFTIGDSSYTSGVDLLKPNIVTKPGHIEIVIRNDIDHEGFDEGLVRDAKQSWLKARQATSY